MVAANDLDAGREQLTGGQGGHGDGSGLYIELAAGAVSVLVDHCEVLNHLDVSVVRTKYKALARFSATAASCLVM